MPFNPFKKTPPAVEIVRGYSEKKANRLALNTALAEKGVSVPPEYPLADDGDILVINAGIIRGSGKTQYLGTNLTRFKPESNPYQPGAVDQSCTYVLGHPKRKESPVVHGNLGVQTYAEEDQPVSTEDSISDQHCLLSVQRNPGNGRLVRAYIQDAASSRGTYVNRVRLNPREQRLLLPEDIVTFSEPADGIEDSGIQLVPAEPGDSVTGFKGRIPEFYLARTGPEFKA